MDTQKNSPNENSLVRVGKLIRVWHDNGEYAIGDIGILIADYDTRRPRENTIFCSFLEYHDGVKTKGQVILFKMLK